MKKLWSFQFFGADEKLTTLVTYSRLMKKIYNQKTFPWVLTVHYFSIFFYFRLNIYFKKAEETVIWLSFTNFSSGQNRLR